MQSRALVHPRLERVHTDRHQPPNVVHVSVRRRHQQIGDVLLVLPRLRRSDPWNRGFDSRALRAKVVEMVHREAAHKTFGKGDAADAIAHVVQLRGKDCDAHLFGDHDQNAAADAGLGGEAYPEGPFSAVVVHSAYVCFCFYFLRPFF